MKPTIHFPKDAWSALIYSTSELDKLVDEYSASIGVVNLMFLEELKKKFIAHLNNFAHNYSHVKKAKGSNHTFLEDYKRHLRAFHVKALLDEAKASKEKLSFSGAQGLVEAYEPYLKDFDDMEDKKESLIFFEEKYNIFQMTFQAIVQSISSSRKEEIQNRM